MPIPDPLSNPQVVVIRIHDAGEGELVPSRRGGNDTGKVPVGRTGHGIHTHWILGGR